MIRRLSLLAGLACVLALAGCGSTDPSSTDSPDTGTAESSAPPSEPTADGGGPSVPQEATGESREAAEAFVGYWIATLNFATDTGETEPLKRLATERCGNCASFAQQLEQIYEGGGHVEGEGWTLQSAVPEADQPADRPAFQVKLQIAPQKVFASDGSKPKSYPGGAQPARIVLLRQDDRWLVDQLDI